MFQTVSISFPTFNLMVQSVLSYATFKLHHSSTPAIANIGQLDLCSPCSRRVKPTTALTAESPGPLQAGLLMQSLKDKPANSLPAALKGIRQQTKYLQRNHEKPGENKKWEGRKEGKKAFLDCRQLRCTSKAYAQPCQFLMI